MKAAGLFPEQRVMLINGVVLETHHGDPRHPDPRRLRFTRDQYRALGRCGVLTGRRTELIYGEVIEMSPTGWPHTVGKNKTAEVLRRAFAGTGWVNEQGPMPVEESDPEPDVAVYPGRMEDYTDHPSDPLLLVEVADSTLARDTTLKAELYATAGVPDYWVLDLENRRLLVFRDPVPLPAGLAATAYRTHLVFGPTDAVAPLAVPTATVIVGELLP